MLMIKEKCNCPPHTKVVIFFKWNSTEKRLNIFAQLTAYVKRGLNMKHTIAIYTCLVLMLLLSSCGGSKEPPVPAFEELSDITMQEYMGDEPAGMEISTGFSYDPEFYSFPGGTYFYNPGYSDWKQITNEKKIPRRETSILFRFTDKSGATTRVFLFGDKKYDYLEIPGAGVWREKKDNINDWMPGKLEDYQELQFSKYYGEPVLSHERPSLLESYNGAEKAVMVDIGEGEGEAGIWNHWWDDHIPAEQSAERAEDVRYVFVLEVLDKKYIGYWYVKGSGQKLHNAYECTYCLRLYDLVTGSEELLYTGTNISAVDDAIEGYFSH